MLCLPSAKSEVSNYRAGLLARLVCFGRNGGKTTATTNTTPTALVRRTVIPPSSLSCVSRSLVPPALLSCAPLLAKGGEAPRTPAIPSSVRAGTGAICAHRHWRQRQQVELAMACGGSASLWHQCRGMAISSGGPINFKRVHGTPQKHGTKEVKEKPRLICLARRVRKLFNNKNGTNDNVAIANNNGDSADLIDIASRKSSASFPSDLSRSVKSMTMTEKLRIEEEQEVVVVEEEEKHIPMNEEEEEEGTITATVVTSDYKEDEASVVTPPPSPPPFQHTVEYSKSSHRRDRDTLVYNIFTHRVVKCSAASVRALGVLGIDVPHDSQELDVVDPSVLLSLQNKLLQKEVSWPPSWRSVLFRQVYNALIYISKEKVVEEVRKLLSLHYQRAKTRHGVGVVSNDDNNTNNLGETEGALLSNEANMSSDSSGDLSLQDRLLTYSDLNEEQQSVVDFVLDGHNTYIGGGAGTGKSLLLRVIKQELVNKGLHVAMTATTGIAATRIDGITLHHCFGVNIHGECTRRKELRAFDVIIVDEVSMLSRDLFESFEYQLRRANGVDLPFGGIQIILSGDFLQLGAIASLPLVHSAIFRRYFAMLKLQESVRQLGNNHFIRQLQELRRGIVPHDLQDTVTFLSPTESAKAMRSDTSSVKLLPTNKEVDIINQAELEKLPGDVVEFPAQLQSPSLSGRWTASYILAIQDEYLNSLDVNVLYKALEQYLLEFVTKVPRSSSLTFSLLGQRYIVLYKLFLDAFVFRVRIPHELNANDEMELASHLRNLESWLPTQGLGVYLKEIIESSDGLHTDVHEYTLTQYANSSPMMSPLRLKKGAKVMLRTNLSPGLVNGGLGVIVGFKELKVEHLPRYLTKSGRLEAVENYIEFLQYEHSYPVALAPEVDFGGGRIIVVPPTTFCVGGLSNTHHYQMGIVAFPLSLAYAFTVHKVQGLTLVGRVHLELSRMWPCEHLLYVAMSRVRNPEQLTVSCFHRDLVRCATECLLFDESLPSVKDVRVLPHFFQATWRRVPSRCKAALRLKEKLKESKKEKNVKKAGSPLRRRVGIVRGFR